MEFLTPVRMNITVFSDATSCSLVGVSYKSVASTIRVFTTVHIGYKSNVHYADINVYSDFSNNATDTSCKSSVGKLVAGILRFSSQWWQFFLLVTLFMSALTLSQ
jgi:hypothetical protein